MSSHLYLLYLCYEFRSSTVIDKQQSVSWNIISVHLSVVIDFASIFIRYTSKQSFSKLSLIATEMISTTVFFHIKKLFLQNENLNKFYRC